MEGEEKRRKKTGASPCPKIMLLKKCDECYVVNECLVPLLCIYKLNPL